MRITLIKPRMGTADNALYVEESRMEPLTLGVIGALTPPDVDVKLYDDRMEAIPYDEPTDLVGITVETWTARRSYQIAAEYRKRGVQVILGGMHPTLVPDEAQAYADSVFTGDAEQGWTDVVADAKAGRLKPRYCAQPGVAQAPRVLPRRDLYVGKGYLPISLLQFSRGCHFACSFCAISAFFDRKVFHRHIDQVLEELERRDHKMVFFVDDNFCANREHAKEMCRAMIPLKLKWVSQSSIDMTLDRELMSLLADSGCLGHVVGFESLNAADLKGMRKAAPNLSVHRDPLYARQLEVLRDHGLQTWASFTFGHDTDTIDTIWRTLDWAIAQKFAFGAFNILKPYPNTPLYRTLEAEGRLLWDGRWWNHPEYRFNHAAFTPRNIDPQQLTDALAEARRIWSAPLTMLKRFLDLKTHMRTPYRMAVYWAYNPVYGRENARKQGMKFGLDSSTPSYAQYVRQRPGGRTR
ncbi:MAG: B12-binding domain-containing radical SAM protein [Gemmatimonadaceae bacterium]|nr:B12-binding domain-containing radical SAM protein [Gemmatimonadaceae bacterium]